MAESSRAQRARALVRDVAKLATSRAGLHVRPYGKRVQGLDPWRDIQVLLSAKASPVIFDVGANRGQSIRRFGRLWPRATIHSFEPSPGTFAVLEQTAREIGGNITTVNAGVGARNSREVLLENDLPDMSSFLRATDRAWGEPSRETPIDVVSLDDYCRNAGIAHIDLLKSDTQGYDLEVLRGARGLLEAGAIQLVFLEVLFTPLYEQAPSFTAIHDFLAERGYRFVYLYEPFFAAEGDLSWCDALYVHGGSGS